MRPWSNIRDRIGRLCARVRTESLQGVVRGVVTTKVVVTTQGGVVTTPNTPCFHVFWGYNLTTPLLRPFSGRRILFKCPLHTARCHTPWRFLRCASPCHGTLPAFASPPAACDAIAPPAPLPQTHTTADATAHRHGAIDFLFKLSARQSSQLHAQPRCPSRPSGGSLRVNSRPRPLACAMSAA